MAADSPRLHVAVHLPPVISFSGPEEPYLEVRVTSDFPEPIIIPLKRSRLWPQHIRPALILTNARTGKGEHIPCCDTWYTGPPIPKMSEEHRVYFLGLQPSKMTTVRVSYRPFDEPYSYGKTKDDMYERMDMMLLIGMQWLKVVEEYEIRNEDGLSEVYMVGDLEEILGRGDEGEEWKEDGICEVVAGEKYGFRVVA